MRMQNLRSQILNVEALSFVSAGVFAGTIFNIALGAHFYNPGGIGGGVVSSLLVYLLA